MAQDTTVVLEDECVETIGVSGSPKMLKILQVKCLVYLQVRVKASSRASGEGLEITDVFEEKSVATGEQ